MEVTLVLVVEIIVIGAGIKIDKTITETSVTSPSKEQSRQ